MEMPTWLTEVLAVVVFGGGGTIWWLGERKEMSERKSAAAAVGWSYSYWKPGLFARYRDLPFIQTGASGVRVKHFVAGRRKGWPTSAFTYRYSRPSTDTDSRAGSSSDVEYGVVTVYLPKALPDLEIAPRGKISEWARSKGLSVDKLIGQRAARLLGAPVQLGDEAFDAAFVVTARMEKYPEKLLTPQARAWLCANSAQDLTVVIQADEIITWSYDTSVEQAVGKADYLIGLLEHMPSDILKPAA